ncbi:hypothetical protein COT77_02650 [Candidatus Berkelbacteria bacterium CG10_big_fil_rev_8_21_14_0_10_41_12]|uniref:DUF5679 domain-containing protein n=1 Tax=Candidatus Berkelbacteria bacterium CG10_big_fil_rev_8_21_14_0_10_41_12 TaxID=1974513 RepID=A0A2M6WWR2_9BACT|nr:MAG: hypothetical protein COT77_02650 [Candidatus Berkelbacteria bacterium CG10_big_fil_rev_8_21_14_0_10_41_12]
MSDEPMTARCMRCKENKEMKDIEEVPMKNGGTMAKGVCVDCGCKMCKFLGKKKEKEEEE